MNLMDVRYWEYGFAKTGIDIATRAIEGMLVAPAANVLGTAPVSIALSVTNNAVSMSAQNAFNSPAISY